MGEIMESVSNFRSAHAIKSSDEMNPTPVIYISTVKNLVLVT